MEFLSTDVQRFVKLGYPEYLARSALRTTRGNADLALTLLKKSNYAILHEQINAKEAVWFGEQDDDWINYIPTESISMYAENRGLFKSPIYLRVGYFRRIDEEVYYGLNVSLKDRRNWIVEKTYADFLRFQALLPIGTNSCVTHGFPFPRLFSNSSNEFCENRRKNLEEWLRDISLSELCMKDPATLARIYAFIDIENHGGMTLSSHRFPFRLEAGFEINFRQLNAFTGSIPISLEALVKLLPCKIPAERLTPPALMNDSSSDVSEKQLAKDYHRDRLIIQGRRLLGSRSSIAEIRQTMTDAVKFVCEQVGSTSSSSLNTTSSTPMKLPKESFDGLQEYFTMILREIGRTESAFLSHQMLNELLNNHPQLESPLPIIPESLLASPIELIFSIKERSLSAPELAQLALEMPVVAQPIDPQLPSPPPAPVSISTASSPVEAPSSPLSRATSPLAAIVSCHPQRKDWTLTCEMQAMTVFRIMDSTVMNPLLQLKVGYRKVLFALPQPIVSELMMMNNNGVSTPDAHSNLKWNWKIKKGGCTLALQPCSQTTSRDWKME